MKFEKLSDNKIRIILTMQDLTEKHIDFHSFMSNSIESQNILIDMLEEAKKETGFDPENFNLKIEALAMADTNFIFTITKVYPENSRLANEDNDEFNDKSHKRKFTIKRKSVTPSTTTQAVYMFNCFDDFCNLLQFLKRNNNISEVNNLADDILLYEYKHCYYLLISNIHIDIASKINFYANITEFARCITNSKSFASKLVECGTLVMKNNALKIGFKHFV